MRPGVVPHCVAVEPAVGRPGARPENSGRGSVEGLTPGSKVAADAPPVPESASAASKPAATSQPRTPARPPIPTRAKERES